MKRGTSTTIPFFMRNASTFAGVSGLLDVTVRISKDGAATAAATNSIVEVDSTYLPGWYKITLTATETDCEILILQAASTTAAADPIVLEMTDETQLDKIYGLLGAWTMSGTTLTTTVGESTRTYTLTKSSGQITAISEDEPTNETEESEQEET